ncbi:hypothetical protein SAMN05421504_102913 [Amycolatopsis xylanica]|uniref:ABC-2 type transport system permease protein n=1 Tax=Amycolatopsis xylanica TaxID=589385 RepID=A0A1H3AH20_9PSEU|nr:hypothetical protein [Amycolatopsis xylanica]SDX28628.1 hypothetical protein SAMN05421504_102913 [Amycolatopsis xylanica]
MTLRVPGRPRFGGVRPGDSAFLLGLFAVGIAIQAFFRVHSLRSFLFGQSIADIPAILGLLVACGALMWRALLRRGFVWAEPAMLTWFDFTGADRARLIGRRMWAVWCVGVGLFVYVGALTGVAGGVGGDGWPAAAALLLGSATLSVSTARRPPIRGEVFGPVLLAALGLVVAKAQLAPFALEVLAATLFLLGALSWRTGDAVSRAGRQALVDGWNERLVRTVSLTFLDPLALLPAARPVRFSLRRPTALRFAWLGVAGRARYWGAAVPLAIAAVLAKAAAPAIPDVVFVALTAYCALIPFAGGVGELWRNDGRRRWLGTSGRGLWLANLLVMLALTVAWGVVLAGAGLVLGLMPSLVAVVVLPIVALAVIRTATRPPTTFDDLGVVTSRVLGQVPTRLFAQLLRGPDVLIFATVVLAVLTRISDGV